jgi:hypothetical protein
MDVCYHDETDINSLIKNKCCHCMRKISEKFEPFNKYSDMIITLVKMKSIEIIQFMVKICSLPPVKFIRQILEDYEDGCAILQTYFPFVLIPIPELMPTIGYSVFLRSIFQLQLYFENGMISYDEHIDVYHEHEIRHFCSSLFTYNLYNHIYIRTCIEHYGYHTLMKDMILFGNFLDDINDFVKIKFHWHYIEMNWGLESFFKIKT